MKNESMYGGLCSLRAVTSWYIPSAAIDIKYGYRKLWQRQQARPEVGAEVEQGVMMGPNIP